MIFIIIEILIVGAVIAIDLTTKAAAVNYLANKPFWQADFINGFMDLKYTENTGASWGIFQDKTLALTVFTGIALGLLLIFLIIRAKKDRKLMRIPLLLIFAGGVGNLVDRIAFGYVRDFLRFTFIEFPIFNLADSAVTIGAILLVIALIVDMIDDGKKLKAKMAENAEHYLDENNLTLKDGKIDEIIISGDEPKLINDKLATEESAKTESLEKSEEKEKTQDEASVSLTKPKKNSKTEN